jgi:hypothetical protein
MDLWLDLLTTYTHNSELQVITALPLISTIHKSPQQPLSLFQPAVSSPAVPSQRLLTVEILELHALRFYHHSLPFRTLWRLRNSTADSQPNSVNPIQSAWGSRFTALGRTQQKTPPRQFYYCCYGRFPRESPDIVDVFTSRCQATHVPSRDSRYTVYEHSPGLLIWHWRRRQHISLKRQRHCPRRHSVKTQGQKTYLHPVSHLLLHSISRTTYFSRISTISL